jgi:hypothetical protein
MAKDFDAVGAITFPTICTLRDAKRFGLSHPVDCIPWIKMKLRKFHIKKRSRKGGCREIIPGTVGKAAEALPASGKVMVSLGNGELSRDSEILSRWYVDFISGEKIEDKSSVCHQISENRKTRQGLNFHPVLQTDFA